MAVERYDLAVVGAGPVGCSAALVAAQRGARVLLLERDPGAAAERCVGEWLHPAGAEILDRLGVELRPPVGYPTGRGFVVYPDDGTSPIVLPYSAGRFGFSLEHGLLVELLRAEVERHEGVDYVPFGQARRVENDVITWELPARGDKGLFARSGTARARRIVAATGENTQLVSRAGVTTFARNEAPPSHRIAGLTLHGARLPFEGYRHLFIGGPGPAIAYRVGPSQVRLLLDVPLSLPVLRRGGLALAEAFAAALPAGVAEAMHRSLAHRAPTWTSGHLRPRDDVPSSGLLRVGDAAGTLHPLTAAGLTLGLGDAELLAEPLDDDQHRAARRRATRVAETAGVGLAELFSNDAPDTIAIRAATYRVWREQPKERLRSMGFIAGDMDSALRFGGSCLRVLAGSATGVVAEGLRTRDPKHTRELARDLTRRVAWMVGGSVGWTTALPDVIANRLEQGRGAAARYGFALSRTGGAEAEVVGLRGAAPVSVEDAIARGTAQLVASQNDDGSFEGEVVWGPMLAAQYVIACHVMGQPIEEPRRARLLRQFQVTRLARGAWGMQPGGEPFLFVTALVYVAARLLGLDKDDPLLVAGRAFLRQEGGAVAIPTWGKLWLALAGLYEWDGLSPIVPELWDAPRWMPVHPSRYFAHTRLIYLGMAALYAERPQGELGPTIRALRDELYVEPYDEIDFVAARRLVRPGDANAPASRTLNAIYRGLEVVEDRRRRRGGSRPVLKVLRERVRYELRSTSHTSISPVSGLLGLLALHVADPRDPDVSEGLRRFETWIWEDDDAGTRVAGTRTAVWDTALSMHALRAVAPFHAVDDAADRADRFLAAQQLLAGTGREQENDRVDPSGGYAFGGAWHGWPVSDVTAEVLSARLTTRPMSEGAAAPRIAAPRGAAERALAESSRDSADRAKAVAAGRSVMDSRSAAAAVGFLLRTRSPDGGFGSYEPKRLGLPLDWLNPAEMFGHCMAESSYAECTASCVAALANFRRRWPDRLGPEVNAAIDAGVASLRATQRSDGSFAGRWGVHFIYGTLFGVRGLLAAGVPVVDPQVRRACAWLLERQRPDGGWGEHFSSVTEGRYVEHPEGQIVQTAWALMTLAIADEPEFSPLERAAAFLAERQDAEGRWPEQDPAGIFFDTALLEHKSYRLIFPTLALGLYQSRARARAQRHSSPSRAPASEGGGPNRLASPATPPSSPPRPSSRRPSPPL